MVAIQAERANDEFFYQKQMDRALFLKWKKDMKKKHGKEFRFFDEV